MNVVTTPENLVKMIEKRIKEDLKSALASAIYPTVDAIVKDMVENMTKDLESHVQYYWPANSVKPQINILIKGDVNVGK